MRMRKLRLLSGILIGCVLSFAAIAVSAGAQTTAANEWTWVGGSSTLPASCVNNPSGFCAQPGVYGTLGIAAAGNIPGARDSAATWTDSNGNFWLFGGEGADSQGVFGQLNDLWEFDPTTKLLTWMGGSSAVPANCATATGLCGQPGVYGTKGTPASASIPGGRSVATYWTDNSGIFWLFGGGGVDASGNAGELNDLWMFNPSSRNWTWMTGSSAVGSSGGQPGVYGTLGATSTANAPGGRDLAVSWVDKDGHPWLYGGQGFDGQGNYGQLDDLWEFNATTNEWAWMGGDSAVPEICNSAFYQRQCGWPAIYGELGVSAAGNSPGSRIEALSWTDAQGNFWLFGGEGTLYWRSFDFSEINEYDLWEFSPSTNEWAWMGGNSDLICGEGTGQAASQDSCNENGVVGTLEVPAVGNIPPSRSGGTSWTDGNGNFWLFGGNHEPTVQGYGMAYCNDIWQFYPSANEWAWMGGFPTIAGQPFACESTFGSWGVLGTPAAGNVPSGRLGTATWIDKTGNFWFFGGYGWPGMNPSDLNDLWVYQPTTPAPTPSFELIASPNPITISETAGATTTGTTTISVIAAGGFDSPVTLTAGSVMIGITTITGSLIPSSIPGAGSSQLTVSVNGTAGPIGSTVPLVITGTSGGISQTTQVVVAVTVGGQVPAPTFSVPTGTYTTAQTVTINDSFGGDSTIDYYTIDGTTPTLNSPVYVGPISISSTATLKAFATLFNYVPSVVVAATYTITPPAATPAFSVPGGTYNSAQMVSVTDATAGSTIYYTTNGTAPTASSTVYSGPISVSSSETLEAVALASGYSSSAVASATYTLNLPPSFSVTGTAVTVAPGATTANTSTITLTPAGGFTGPIALSCAITPVAASDPATCSVPGSATITGAAAQTTTLTVNTTAATSALNQTRKLFWPSAGSAVLACILLIGIPARRRRWQRIVGMLVLLFSIADGLLACGGGGSGAGGGGGGGGGGNAGTTAGTYSITVTGTSGAITETGAVTLTVQ